jgi:hypothetical protein
MPDSRGAFQGQGWSRKREEGWQRVFGTEMRAHDHDWDRTFGTEREPGRLVVAPAVKHAADAHESTRDTELRGLANLAETILDDAYADFLRRRRVS